MRLRFKFLISFILVAFIPVLAIQLFLYTSFSSELQDRFLGDLDSVNRRAFSEFDASIKKYGNLTLSSATLPPLFGLYRANETGFDVEESTPEELWKERLGSIFSSFVDADSSIDQMRYLNKDGLEIVRVNNVDGDSFVVPGGSLQDKSNSYYFENAKTRGPGEVFISDLDLNVENGEVELPFKPNIRYVSPVYIENDFFGVIVLNIEKTALLSSFPSNTVILDQDGDYIYGNSLLLLSDYGPTQNYFEESDGYQDSGIQEFVQQGYFFNTEKNTHVFFRRVIIDSPEGRSLLVLTEESEESVAALVNNSARTILYISLIVLGVVILIAFVFARRVSKPIEELTRLTKLFSEGDFRSQIDGIHALETKDEVGELAHSFEVMREKIQDFYENLEDKVDERTKELESKNEDLDKTKSAMLNVLEDIQKEKLENENQRRRLQVILESLPVGVFIAEPIEGRPEFVNKKGIELLGKGIDPNAAKENYGKVYSIVKENGDVYPQEELPLAETLRTKEAAVKGDLFINKGDGKKVAIFAASSPVLDEEGNLLSAIVVFQDKTREYEVDKAKTEFVSLASHQLRTPLSAINWYTEMLLSGDAGELNEEQKKYVKEVATGSERMVDLVNSLLNVSRLELGTFMVEPVKTNVVQLARSVLDELKPTIDDKKQVVAQKFNSSFPEINVDPKLLRMVFQNYLSNAVKYTAEGGEIEVGLAEENGKMLFSVKDSGMGIPENQKKNIFGKLFRADNVKATDTEGTGLGLYIVKQIIEQSGGRVWFESKENEGSTFYVELPMSGMKERTGSRKLS
jgi:signal transduction histidine kinase